MPTLTAAIHDENLVIVKSLITNEVGYWTYTRHKDGTYTLDHPHSGFVGPPHFILSYLRMVTGQRWSLKSYPLVCV